ncbi:TonB-dependent receptor [Flavobacteriaceae bacterium]|nr:TonB-dependent receptor [Flavobacteriaceae bacterium]
MVVKKGIVLCGLLLTFFCNAQKQVKDSIQLEEVIISVTKIKDSLVNTPFSVSIKNFSTFQKSAEQFNISEYIEDVPGIFISNDNNYAQDSRISIRGFGSRANFGIRGIKLIVDGVPETTPDGQSQIDNLNLEIIEKVEVIRGVGSSLYGNSSAGIIKIKTLQELQNSFARIGFSLGSNQQNKSQFFLGQKYKKTSYTFLYSQTKSNGYRNNSDFKNNNLNINLFKKVNDKTNYGLSFNYVDSPYAIDPGGLTIEEVEDNRKQARERNVIYDSKESIKHLKLSGSFEKKISNKLTFSKYLFFSNRDFNGNIPVKKGGTIKLDRKYWGLGASLLIKNKFNTQIGFDLGNQKDLRKRYFNNEGEIGALVLEQNEKFINYGIFLVSSLKLNSFIINPGIRLDKNTISIDDRFLADGNSSDKINLNSLNPSLGINYKSNSFNRFFVNVSTGFETPTLNEFGSSPIGSGFNKNLKSQNSINYELGFSKKSINNKFKLDLIYFNTSTKNEVLPYEDSQFPGQVFYNNAGKTQRSGIEFSGSYNYNNFWNFNSSISIGRYLFDEFIDNEKNYSGNKIPGVPEKTMFFNVNYKNESKLSVSLQLKVIGDLYANNSNSVKVDGFNRINLKISKGINYKKITIDPFLIFKNILGTSYYDNIRINAFGARYYEPAAKANFYGGIKIKF